MMVRTLLRLRAAKLVRSCLQAAVLLVGGFGMSIGFAQSAIGPGMWDCQTNGHEGGPATTQLQAAANWLANYGLTLSALAGQCEALGTSRYQFCPLSSGGNMDVYLVCPNGGGISPDGLTCPGGLLRLNGSCALSGLRMR
jgi:hypothetical protein